jgi:DNA-binding XRE family transcriptional regulator
MHRRTDKDLNWNPLPLPPIGQEDRIKNVSGKDTKEWCKGVVGRDHKLQWQIYHGGFEHLGCTVCGKLIDWRGFSDDLSAEIKRIRKFKRLSQEELGKLCDMSQEAISQVEKANRWSSREVSVKTYRRILDALG